MPDERDGVRASLLQKAIKRAVEKREVRVITGLVNDYRAGTLTQERTYAAIMAIAELRYAGNNIEKEDLQ